MTTTRPLVCLLVVTILGTTTVPAQDGEFEVPSGQRQLFIDDHGIEKIDGLTRTMHRPEKKGAVIRGPSPHKTIQTRAAPAWDPVAKVYKLWVLTIDEAVWQSRDGLHWTPAPNPNLRVLAAVFDPHASSPSTRFKGVLLNEGFATSEDGIAWTRTPTAKVGSSDEGNFSYDPQSRLFIHTVKRGGRFGRSLAIATSQDFEHWRDYGVVFQTDERDQELGRKAIAERFADPHLHHPPYNDPGVYNVDVYNMGVFRYEGLFLGIPALYHATGPVPNYPNTVGFHRLQLAASRDLKTWARVGDRATFLGPSRLDSGAYDLTQILPPSAPILRDDELWFYYTGLKWRGTFRYEGTYPNGKTILIPGKDRDGGAICLAVLRRDGFVSLDAGSDGGSVVTKPFRMPGGKLHVNANIAEEGELVVEVLSEKNETLAVSEILVGDQRRAVVTWKGGAPDEGRAIRLRLRVRSGRLYSYWFEAE